MYKLVVLASMRALELNAGAAQLTQQEKGNVLQAALYEIAEDKITYA
jgi:DNA-directed RNA polymerase omega subunit